MQKNKTKKTKQNYCLVKKFQIKLKEFKKVLVYQLQNIIKFQKKIWNNHFKNTNKCLIKEMRELTN